MRNLLTHVREVVWSPGYGVSVTVGAAVSAGLVFLAFAWLLGVAAAAFTGADPRAALAAAAGLGALSFARAALRVYARSGRAVQTTTPRTRSTNLRRRPDSERTA